MSMISKLALACLSTAALTCASAQDIRAISTETAPKAIGPYSQAIMAGNTLYISGTLPIDPKSNALDKDAPIEAQTTLILENIKAILAAEGMTMDHIVSTTVYMQDLNEFAKMNETYATFFPGAAPARATVQVARLPRDVKVEIGAVAVKP